MLLGLVGLAGSGKDTVAAHLVKEYGYERRAFADILKRSAAALLGINAVDFEELKNDPKAYVRVEKIGGAVISSMSVREFLQRYGTESHREIFGNDFWVDQILPMSGYYNHRNIVLTDCRYQSETDRVKALKGFVVRVSRPAARQDSHSSETEQSFIRADFLLNNDGTLKDLPDKIEQMLQHLEFRIP